MKTIKALIDHTIMVKESTIALRYVIEIPESDDWWNELRLQADMKATVFGKSRTMAYSVKVLENKEYEVSDAKV